MEQPASEQDVPDGYEEQGLAEAIHIALAGADDTMDIELDMDEADAEVGSITTTAQSRSIHGMSRDYLLACHCALSVVT